MKESPAKRNRVLLILENLYFEWQCHNLGAGGTTSPGRYLHALSLACLLAVEMSPISQPSHIYL